MRLYSWKATDVAFDDLKQVNKELDDLYGEKRWLRLNANGEIDENSRFDPWCPDPYSFREDEEIAEILARHLVSGKIVFTTEDEYGEYAGWLVQPGKAVPLSGRKTVEFVSPEGDVVAVETEE